MNVLVASNDSVRLFQHVHLDPSLKPTLLMLKSGNAVSTL